MTGGSSGATADQAQTRRGQKGGKAMSRQIKSAPQSGNFEGRKRMTYILINFSISSFFIKCKGAVK